MLTKPTSSSQSGIDKLAQAWLGAGAKTVSVWDRQRLVRHWPDQASLGETDFVTPIRIAENLIGEMHISGLDALSWEGRHRLKPKSPEIGAAADSVVESAETESQCKEQPTAQAIDTFGSSCPSLEVGGDYYDFVSQPDGRLAFSVVDISGKGVSAAIFVPRMHLALRNGLRATAKSAPHDVMTCLNNDIYQHFASNGFFATALVGFYDPAKHEVTYANAGHSPVIYRRRGGIARMVKADTVPLGIQKDLTSVERTLKLERGDVLLIGTDGLTEARNDSGQMFGHQRLMALVDLLTQRTAKDIAEIVLDKIAAFVGHAQQNDDRTIMVLKGV